jgi:isopropylmalate/homocitrate/citramalate synthase
VNTIQLYDATLRDGMQGEGMSLSAEEKLRVAHALDDLGVELIEAGFPASNPKERELFELLAAERFDNAQIAAFGMTRRRDTSAAEDPALVLLAESVAPVCTLVGKTWTLHLEKIVKVDRAENLRMIAESIAFLRGEGKRVIYDAEHYFDGWRAEPEYAIACITAAAEAGAETVVLCDTNGSSLPSQIAAATGRCRGGARPDSVPHRHSLSQRPRVRRRELARGGRGRRAPGAGHGQRLRRAHRQREPDLDHREPAVEARLPVSQRASSWVGSRRRRTSSMSC